VGLTDFLKSLWVVPCLGSLRLSMPLRFNRQPLRHKVKMGPFFLCVVLYFYANKSLRYSESWSDKVDYGIESQFRHPSGWKSLCESIVNTSIIVFPSGGIICLFSMSVCLCLYRLYLGVFILLLLSVGR